MAASFLFYDLETYGTDPRRTRIAQFAAIRTDADLEQIEEPHDFLVRPADDVLPSPTATLITGILPQTALRDGLREAEAFARIHEAMATPETCSLGYNSLRFDDEFIRHGLFRNFFDPYEREWRGGNSRWDLLDVMRLAHALRPEGIVWPKRDDGATSFRLEHLADANAVRIGDAHEALSDVRALIGMARKLRHAHPRLWEYALRLRDKRFAARLLDSIAMTPVLHVSQRFPASRLCAAAVLPIARHPRIDNRVIVLDLHDAPDDLLALDVDDIVARLYTPVDQLPEGVHRIALKEVHLNRSPMLVDWTHLRAADFERLGIDPAQVEARAAQLRAVGPVLAEKVRRVFARQPPPAAEDVDGSLYDGFLLDPDRRRFPEVRGTPPDSLGQRDFAFQDPRLPELLFRYRARNWPESLDADGLARWNAYRRHRLLDAEAHAPSELERYRAEIAALRDSHSADAQTIARLDALVAWGDALEAGLPPAPPTGDPA